MHFSPNVFQINGQIYHDHCILCKSDVVKGTSYIWIIIWSRIGAKARKFYLLGNDCSSIEGLQWCRVLSKWVWQCSRDEISPPSRVWFSNFYLEVLSVIIWWTSAISYIHRTYHLWTTESNPYFLGEYFIVTHPGLIPIIFWNFICEDILSHVIIIWTSAARIAFLIGDAEVGIQALWFSFYKIKWYLWYEHDKRVLTLTWTNLCVSWVATTCQSTSKISWTRSCSLATCCRACAPGIPITPRSFICKWTKYSQQRQIRWNNKCSPLQLSVSVPLPLQGIPA